MDYLPLFFDLRGRRCLVAGAGEAAARKAALLARAGARVRVVGDDPEPDESLLALARDPAVTLSSGPLSDADFEDCVLAVIALDDAGEAARAAALAARHTPAVNVVDRPDLCTCIMPALVDRSPVVVAISTAGAAPVLGRFLRARLEALLPARLGELAALARDLRPEVSRRLAPAARRRYWEGVLQGPVAELVFQGRADDARAAMQARLESDGGEVGGEIYAVTPPAQGDPENVTLRALRLLQQADLVIHDAGLPVALLDLVRRDAPRREVDTPPEPAAIARELIDLALEGRRVGWLSARAHDPALARGAADAGVAYLEAR